MGYVQWLSTLDEIHKIVKLSQSHRFVARVALSLTPCPVFSSHCSAAAAANKITMTHTLYTYRVIHVLPLNVY